MVAGRILRNALLITGLDSVSAGIIDADLAWYEGQQVLADTLLTNVKPAEWEGELFVLATRQQRFQLQRRWLDAARLAHRRLIIAHTKMLDPSSSDSACLLYTSPSPRDRQKSRMPSSA